MKWSILSRKSSLNHNFDSWLVPSLLVFWPLLCSWSENAVWTPFRRRRCCWFHLEERSWPRDEKREKQPKKVRTKLSLLFSPLSLSFSIHFQPFFSAQKLCSRCSGASQPATWENISLCFAFLRVHCVGHSMGKRKGTLTSLAFWTLFGPWAEGRRSR